MLSITQLDVSSQQSIGKRHLAWLDSLRAVAALYVMMSHILLTIWPNPSNFHGLTFVLAGPYRYGHYAVGLFIVLSGFSLMLPISRNDGVLRGGAVRFFGRRAKRILPTYYSALVLSLLAIHFLIGTKTSTHWDISLPVTTVGLWSHLLMLQDIFSSAQINHAFWSISVEWRIYFLFPLLVVLFGKWGGIRVSSGMVVFSVLMYSLLRGTVWIGITPAYYALFTFGMLACEISFGHKPWLCKVRDQISWLGIMSPLFIAFLALLYKWRSDTSPLHIFLMDILNGLVCAILLIVLSRQVPNRFQELLSWKPLVLVGTFAYSIYLIHAPLIQIIWQYGLHPLHQGPLATYLLMVFIGIPITVGLAFLFFLAFERPFLNTKIARK